MLKDIQETIIIDVQDSVRKILSASTRNLLNDESITTINEILEVTILNSFWKHGIAGTIRTEKGENI
jgi:hypothetical protein